MKLFSRKLGDQDERQRELRDDRIRRIIASGKVEIPRSALEFGPRWIEDTRTGDFFRPYPNADPSYADHCPAFYFDDSGDAVLLERSDPASRDELEERRAGREARRAAREAEQKARRDRARRQAGR